MRILLGAIAMTLAAPGWCWSADRPNVLLAISDDQSHPHASAYGSSLVNTPAFDRVARQGVLFHNALSGSPGCSPSRASLLTGCYPWQLEHAGTHASSFSKKFAVYPDLLESAGYFVGYTGKGWGPGNWNAGGRERNPAGVAWNRKKTKRRSPKGVSATDYAANFAAFLEARPQDAPFCFWLGGSEPHRGFEAGSGRAAGKKLADAKPPSFLPDEETVRSDLLDYALEIEHFDGHLARALELLEGRGELENTLVIVTSDNGMAFPRAKANCYEYGVHVPLAIRWGKVAARGRKVEDLVSFADLAPTILEAAGAKTPDAMSGRSLTPILMSDQQGQVDPARTAAYSGRERHSSSRYKNLAYPQRCIRTREYLLIRNFRPDRWPAGAPRKLNADGSPGPPHGGYHDIDACPTLDLLIKRRDEPEIGRFFHLAVDKRPAIELFDIVKDPGCLNNLAGDRRFESVEKKLAEQLEKHLRRTGDPRVLDGGDIFETYKRYSRIRKFPEPTE